ncbi:MAG: endonuclease/exonuclease/phosphatase family protein [Myxococcales bacterium]|nr:endonuclease/exonuclease/phosphatase family protein [Myxococcales bacterium]
MDRLRVATLNVWNRCDPWEQRLATIREQLEGLAPDVIGLQEALRGEGFDQAASIAEGLGYHVAFGSTREEPIQMGNAILSRFPVLRSEVIALPDGGTSERRCLVHAVLDAPMGPLPFFVTHLNWKLHEGHVRCLQVRCVADAVKARAPIHEFPPVVVGDFNAEPGADEIRFLGGLTGLGGPCTYFADCFALVGEGEGVTFSCGNPFAAQNREPERRIDYVFVRGPDARGRGRPLSARRCFDRPGTNGVFASDHYGVVAEVSR